MTTDRRSDGELWDAVGAGDGDAIAGLYDRYADRVHGYCFRRTGSWELAQDLTSVVWLEVWRQRATAKVHPDGSLAPWLFGIAHNVVRTSHRSLRRHRAALARLPTGTSEPDHADQVGARLDDQQRVRAVLARVSRLPTHQQAVLGLVVWAGLDHSEVAVALGISVGTVKSRLSRARARLRSVDPPDPAPAVASAPPPAPATRRTR